MSFDYFILWMMCEIGVDREGVWNWSRVDHVIRLRPHEICLLPPDTLFGRICGPHR